MKQRFGKAAVTLFMKSRNSTRRRRFEWVAMIFPVATSSAANSCCGAMPLVIVALAGQGAAIGQLQITLRSLQSLDRGLLVDAQHDRLSPAGDVEADNIGGFGREVRVVALAPGLASHQVNLVAAQEPPDISDMSTSPSASASRGPVQRANPCGGGFSAARESACRPSSIDRLSARPRLVLQPFKAMVGIAMPPRSTIRGWTPTSWHRPGAAPIRRQQNNPCPLQIALQRHRARQHASSTLRSFLERWTSLASGIIPTLNRRLTFQEKRALALTQTTISESQGPAGGRGH